VGVSDFSFAEIQGGLTEGEVVSLELPKEEREKKARQLVAQSKSGSNTNAGLASGGRGSGSSSAEKGPRKKDGGRGPGGPPR
jgi:hypothetical protein